MRTLVLALLLLTGCQREAVVLGDSIAHGAADSLRDALCGLEVTNRAVPGSRIGATSVEVRTLPDDVAVAYVHVGVNDAVLRNPYAVLNMRNLLVAMRDRPEVAFVVDQVGPVGDAPEASEAIRRDLNAELLAFRADNVKVVPFVASRFDDGVHPSDYAEQVPVVVSAIREMRGANWYCLTPSR